MEETFGACYGGLERNLHDDAPDYRLPPLNEDAKKEIDKLKNANFTLSDQNGPKILLGAASGLQISEKYTLKFDPKLEKDEIKLLTDQLKYCKGPHVGSYHNKVFKRFMYETGLPLVIFITGDKIDCEIEVGHCHFILDSEFTWEEFYTEYPLAFCIGCSNKNKSKYIQMFKNLNFNIIDENSGYPITAFIAQNDAFNNKLDESIQKFQALNP